MKAIWMRAAVLFSLSLFALVAVAHAATPDQAIGQQQIPGGNKTLHNRLAFARYGSVAGATPTINALSSSTLARSGWLEISGSGFGAVQEGSVVLIGALEAPVASWAEGRIVAYVPETAPVAVVRVQVLTASGSSNTLALTVTMRPAPARVLWRFQVDDPYVQGRPAVGADGTVYAAGIGGHLYALTPEGGLKWIYSVAPLPVQQSVSVGTDGTIYFAAANTLVAVNPDGTSKWQIVDRTGALIVIGPNVGPDGNIYAVTDLGTNDHLGLFSATPDGAIRWTRPGFVVPRTRSGYTLEIVFTPGQLYFTINKIDGSGGIFAYNFAGDQLWVEPAEGQPAVAPDNTIYAQTVNLANSYAALGVFNSDGDLERTLFGEGTRSLTSPDAGPDGTLYIGQNYSNLLALDSSGQQKWVRSRPDYVHSPIVNAQNTVLAVGRESSAPLVGYIDAFSIPAGNLLWSYTLPSSDAASITAMSRPRFSNDGATFYVGMANNTTRDNTSWVYAFAATPTGESAGTPSPTATTSRQATATVTHTVLPASATATRTMLPASITATSTVLPPGVTATAAAAPCIASFSDVLANNPFYAYVHALACNGVISGYGDGTFRPNASVTRGQLAKIIILAAGIEAQIPAAQQTFRDVDPASAFWLYVEQLYARGAISGYDCGAGCLDFRPGSGATRGQIAKIVANAAGIQTDVPAEQQTFRDVPPADPFWVYVERLATRNVFSGYDGDAANINPCTAQPEVGPGRYFRVCSLTTRGQMAKAAANALYPGAILP